MILLIYDINKLPDFEVQNYINLLPQFMRIEVNKYRFMNDRKRSLVARLMLLHSLHKENSVELISKWERGKHNKPGISAWKPFSISHSKDFVLFACDESVIGIDIEKKEDSVYLDIIDVLHPEEQFYILTAKSSIDAFYEIWTKKESFMKAIGLGLTLDLCNFNCVEESMMFEGEQWHFKRLPVCNEYVSYLCTKFIQDQLHLCDFDIKSVTIG